MTESLVLLSLIFAGVMIAGIFLIAFLWWQAGQLRAENQRLNLQVEILMDLLERYWSRQRDLAPDRQHVELLSQALEQLAQLRALASAGVVFNDSHVSIGNDMVGGDTTRRDQIHKP